MPTHTDKETMMPMNTHMTETKTWPELAIGLYDRLTGRGARDQLRIRESRGARPR